MDCLLPHLWIQAIELIETFSLRIDYLLILYAKLKTILILNEC